MQRGQTGGLAGGSHANESANKPVGKGGRPTGEELVMSGLLIFVPLTLVGDALGWPSGLLFFLSVAAVIPLAAFIGWATEALAERIGGKAGGLLNATFGNAPDLLVGVFGLQKGLIPLVKATLIGALISNSALIMGLCYFAAGLIHGRPRFRREEAGHHSVLMMLTLAAVLFPSLGAFVLCRGITCPATGAPMGDILQISVAIAVVLLVAYLAYMAFAIFGWESLRRRPAEGEQARQLVAEAPRTGRAAWPVWLSLALLGGATVALVPITDILTGTVTGATQALGWSQFFVGILIVANAGNVAEGYAALKLAIQKPGRPPAGSNEDTGLDLALGIASASSIQIATFVAPLVVFYGLLSHPMNLVFSPVEIAILALLVTIFTFIAQDGESNWLEGIELLAFYAMAGILFYTLPPAVFGG